MADEYFLYDGVDNVFSEDEAAHPTRFPVLAQEAVEQETSEHIQSPSTSPHPHPANLFSPSPAKDSDINGTPGTYSVHYFSLL